MFLSVNLILCLMFWLKGKKRPSSYFVTSFILFSEVSLYFPDLDLLCWNSMFKFGNIVFCTRPYPPSLWNTTPKQQRHTQCASWKLDAQGHYVIRAYSIPESFSLRPQMLFWPSRFWSPLFLIWFLYVELHLQPLCVLSERREAVRLHSDQTQWKHRFFHRFQ